MGYFSDIIRDSHIPARPTPTAGPTPTADLTAWTPPEPVVDRPRTDPGGETPPESVERPEVGERARPRSEGKRRGDIDIETASAETAVETQHTMERMTTTPAARGRPSVEAQVQSADEWTEPGREEPAPVVATVQPALPEPAPSPPRHSVSFGETDGRGESESTESADRPAERTRPNDAPKAVEAAVRKAEPPGPAPVPESGPVSERDDASADPSPEGPEAPMAAPREPVLARVKPDPPRRPAADRGEGRPGPLYEPAEWQPDPVPGADTGSGVRNAASSPAPPQVRIGQVNVIVESPKSPQGPTGPKRRGIDRNRRIFLRSL